MERADVRELMKDTESRKRNAKSVATQIADLERTLEEAGELAAAGKITLRQLAQMNESLLAKLEALRRESYAPDRERVLGEIIRAEEPRRVWNDWSPDLRRAAVHILFERIDILPLGKRHAWFNPDGVRITWRTT